MYYKTWFSVKVSPNGKHIELATFVAINYMSPNTAINRQDGDSFHETKFSHTSGLLMPWYLNFIYS